MDDSKNNFFTIVIRLFAKKEGIRFHELSTVNWVTGKPPYVGKVVMQIVCNDHKSTEVRIFCNKINKYNQR